MSSTEIILIVSLLLFAGFRLYQKYSKKNADKAGGEQQKQGGTSFPSLPKEDDYDPYSGK